MGLIVVSSRTTYRLKRIQYIREIVVLLLDMMLLDKKELEKVPIPFFKKLKKAVELRQFEKIYSRRFLTS